MKKLKIKDSIDMNELLKYGFIYVDNTKSYFKKSYLGNDNDDRVCYKIEQDRIIKITRLDGEIDDTLYILFTNNLIDTTEYIEDVKNYISVYEAIDICKNIINNKFENDLSMIENDAINIVLKELDKQNKINELQNDQIKLLKNVSNPHFM